MGISKIFDKIKERKKTEKHTQMLSGGLPIYTQGGESMYVSDVIEQAVSCIVMELMKLEPVHIKGRGEELTRIDGTVQSVLDDPNEYMTTSDMLQKIGYQLLSNYNCFILPVYEKIKQKDGSTYRSLKELYPIQPNQVDFLEDVVGNKAVRFTFISGYQCTISLKDVIHLKWHYHMNEFMGGDNMGQPNNKALSATVQLNNVLQNSISQAIKSSFSINALVRYKTLLKQEEMDKAIEDFTNMLQKNQSGIVGIDQKADVVRFNKDIKMVDPETLKFIDQKILRHFGVSLPILSGDYTKNQYEAFYQKTIEPFVVTINQGFTKGLFDKQKRRNKHRIKFYTNMTEFMTMSEKIETAKTLGASGTLFENEKREIFGWAPKPELAGKRLQSLNYIDVDIAPEYQKKKKGKTIDE